MADRQLLADNTGVDIKAIKGKCISRKKSDTPSGMTIDQLIVAVGYEDKYPLKTKPTNLDFGF